MNPADIIDTARDRARWNLSTSAHDRIPGLTFWMEEGAIMVMLADPAFDPLLVASVTRRVKDDGVTWRLLSHPREGVEDTLSDAAYWAVWAWWTRYAKPAASP